jgi:hypothetical protein
MIYRPVKCSVRGWCNTTGPDGTCAKCGKRPSGGIWTMRFRFAGRFVHESTRTASKTVAREAERQRRRELVEKWNRIERRTLPPRLEQALTQSLEQAKPHLAERTNGIYTWRFDAILSPPLARYFSATLTHAKLPRIRRKAEGASARTLNKELQVLRQVLKRHKLWGMLQGEVKFEREHASTVAYGALARWAGRLQKTEPDHYVFPSCENARFDAKHPRAANVDATRPIKSWRMLGVELCWTPGYRFVFTMYGTAALPSWRKVRLANRPLWLSQDT